MNSIRSKILAGLVHALTGSGLILGFLGIVFIYEEKINLFFILLSISIFIDGIDGTFARKLKVKEVLPNFDGALLDNIVDFINYSLLSAFFVLKQDLVFENMRLPIAILILVASGFQFSRNDAKIEGFFVGFPSLWSIMIIVMVVVKSSLLLNSMLFIICFALSFSNIKFIYPSKNKFMQKTTIFICLLMFLFTLLSFLVPKTQILNITKIILVVGTLYYWVLSLYLTYRKA